MPVEIRVGQLWRDETDGYLYKIVSTEFGGGDLRGEYVFARHPNAKRGGFQILRAWFSEPHWTLVRDAKVAAMREL